MTRKIVLVVVAVLLMALGMTMAYTIIAIRVSQVRNGEILRYVRDCAVSNGTCARRANRQRARGVADLTQLVIYANACASGRMVTPAVIEACVRRYEAQKP